jgi:hypothetical protein
MDWTIRRPRRNAALADYARDGGLKTDERTVVALLRNSPEARRTILLHFSVSSKKSILV